MTEQLALLPGYLTAHLQLVLSALLLGVLTSVPLGVALTRRARWEPSVLLVASLIQTIPSLALLALMVPLLAWLGLPSLGYVPAFLALLLYSVLPILRNTVTGISGVDAELKEAALAVGMTPRECLLRLELVLALPVIVAGIRTATSFTVGMATLSTPVGGASLGNYIFSGLQTRNLSAILVGCIAAGGLALLLDGLARLLLLGVERRRRAALWLALCGFGGLYAYAGGSAVWAATSRGPRPISIGAKTFTEQYILSELLAETVRRATGTPTEAKQSLGSAVVFDALVNGQIDAYVDYSGTIWTTIMGRSEVPESRELVVSEARTFLKERYGIRLVGALGFENAYALAMRRAQAHELGVERISDLMAHAAHLSIAADYEFLGRPEYRNIVAKYGLRFASQRSMDPSLMYDALKNRSVDVISAFSSDGRIAAFDLVLLGDDRAAIPPYDAIILAGKELSPAAVSALESLVGRIDGDAMRRMNLRVDGEHATPSQVARDFLKPKR